MKITRFPQSCLLVETENKNILVDPGNIQLQEKFDAYFEKADAILITHKHPDHCDIGTIQKLLAKKEIKIYSTKEVQEQYLELPIQIVKQGEKFSIGEVEIEVTHAQHGYAPFFKNSDKLINENVGYILDDGKTRLYTTSDTICFPNEYKCDVLCVPISDHGLTMGAFDAALSAKETGCKLVIPVHLDNPKFPIDYEFLAKHMKENEVSYRVLNILESVEI